MSKKFNIKEWQDKYLNESKQTADEVKEVIKLANKYNHVYYYDSLDTQDKFVIYLEDATDPGSFRQKLEYIYRYDYLRDPSEIGWHVYRNSYTPTGKTSIKRVKQNPDVKWIMNHIKKNAKLGKPAR